MRQFRNDPTSGELAKQLDEMGSVTHVLTKRLVETFVTPLDRQEIYNLVSSLDDITAFCKGVAGYILIYRLESLPERAKELAVSLSKGCQKVEEAVAGIQNPNSIGATLIELLELEKKGAADRASLRRAFG